MLDERTFPSGATAPTTMRAALIKRHGGPEVIEVGEVAVPRPKSDEVLVQVIAAGCNNTDIWTREGAYGTNEPAGWLGPLVFPRIQGADVVGRVVGCGGDAGRAMLGAKVLVDPANYDSDGADARPNNVLGSERDGGFAEYVVVPVSRAHRVDDSPLSDIELAALPISYGTALGMLDRAMIGPGDDVLVTGASGGVGLAAVQLAQALGARVVGVCSAAKGEAVAAAGAVAIVDRGRGEVVTDASAAAPRGYAAVVDVVAGPVLKHGLGLLRPGGRWVVAGALDGWAVEVDVRRLYLSNLALVGSTMHTPRLFAELVHLARQGRVRPVVAATFPLRRLAEAQAELAKRRHVGKIVIA